MNFSIEGNGLRAHVDLAPELEQEFEEHCKRLVTEASGPPLIDLSDVSYISKEYTTILAHAADAATKRGLRMKVRLKHHLARMLEKTSYNLVGDVEEAR